MRTRSKQTYVREEKWEGNVCRRCSSDAGNVKLRSPRSALKNSVVALLVLSWIKVLLSLGSAFEIVSKLLSSLSFRSRLGSSVFFLVLLGTTFFSSRDEPQVRALTRPQQRYPIWNISAIISSIPQPLSPESSIFADFLRFPLLLFQLIILP